MNKKFLIIEHELLPMIRIPCSYAELDDSGRFLIVVIEEEDDGSETTKCYNTKHILKYTIIDRKT